MAYLKDCDCAKNQMSLADATGVTALKAAKNSTTFVEKITTMPELAGVGAIAGIGLGYVASKLLKRKKRH
jgi:hypothetical protein